MINSESSELKQIVRGDIPPNAYFSEEEHVQISSGACPRPRSRSWRAKSCGGGGGGRVKNREGGGEAAFCSPPTGTPAMQAIPRHTTKAMLRAMLMPRYVLPSHLAQPFTSVGASIGFAMPHHR